jgi:phosphonate transport system substrate-binding protein
MLLKTVLSLFTVLTLFNSINAQQKKPLVLATYAYSVNNRLSSLQPLAEYLQSKTGIAVTVESYPTVQLLMEAIRTGKVQLAMINTLGYLSFQKKNPGIAIPLVTLDLGNKKLTNYGGCILARKDSHIRSLKDLLTDDTIFVFAMVNRSSTSGNLVPRLLLNSAGIPDADRTFNVKYAGTHAKVIDDLLANRAALGGCGCHEYEKQSDSIPGLNNKLVKIASFDDIPLGPIVYRKGLDAPGIDKIKAALLGLHQQSPDVLKQFSAGWTEFLNAKRFRVASDKDYNKFRAMFGNNESLWNLLED